MVRAGNQSWHKGKPQYPKDIQRFISDEIPTGKVIMQDNFECLLKWESSVPGGIVEKNTVLPVWAGSASLKITAPLGIGTTAISTRQLSVPRNKKWGLALRLGPLTDAVRHFFMNFWWVNGPTELGVALRYRVANHDWQIRTLGGGWVNIPDSWMDITNVSNNNFVYCKMVADLTSRKYKWVYINGLMFYLDTVDIDVFASGINREFMHIELGVTSESQNPVSIWLDNVVFTNEEFE